MAQVLADRLRQLGEQKHPLEVRKGTHLLKALEAEPPPGGRRSRQIKAGGRTYFLDLERSQADGRSYLRITESRVGGKGRARKRVSLLVFPEAVAHLIQALTELSAYLPTND